MSRWSAPALPPARDPAGPYRVGIVCLGNICRSPMAEVVLRRALSECGLGEQVELDSGGTGDWHLGEPMDERAYAALRSAGYDGSAHRARQVASDWFDRHDLLLAMDARNFADLRAAAPDAHVAQRVVMFRAFDPEASDHDRDVPDPYAGGADDFALVLGIVERTARTLTEQLALQLRSP